jgi:hypothetical protein
MKRAPSELSLQPAAAVGKALRPRDPAREHDEKRQHPAPHPVHRSLHELGVDGAEGVTRSPFGSHGLEALPGQLVAHDLTVPLSGGERNPSGRRSGSASSSTGSRSGLSSIAGSCRSG